MGINKTTLEQWRSEAISERNNGSEIIEELSDRIECLTKELLDVMLVINSK